LTNPLALYTTRVVECHMVRQLVTRLALLLVSCTHTESATLQIPLALDAPDYCVTGYDDEQTDELAALVREALIAWRVGSTVHTSARRDCIAVYMVEEYEGTQVGETTYSFADERVVSITLAAWWWTICPDARRAVVLHEVGHSVGYWGHSEAPGVMAPGVDCRGHTYLPVWSEVDLAARVREVW
jgi:hypothetical protein